MALEYEFMLGGVSLGAPKTPFSVEIGHPGITDPAIEDRRNVAFLSDDVSANCPFALVLANDDMRDLILEPGKGASLEINFGDLLPWAEGILTEDVPAGATSIPVDEVDDWIGHGSILAVFGDGASTEAVIVTGASAASGAGRLTLKAGTACARAHSRDTRLAGGVETLQVSAPGWLPTFMAPPPGRPRWQLTPTGRITVPGGGRIRFTIDNLIVSGDARPGGVTVDYRNLDALGSGTHTAPFSVADPPSPDKRELRLGEDWNCDFSRGHDVVYVTRGTHPVANTLDFSIGNASQTQPLASGTGTPVFYVSFAYGTGPGALTTVEHAWDVKIRQVGEGPTWAAEGPLSYLPLPCWKLTPPDGSVLGAGESVTFRLSEIVSPIPPGTREFVPQPVAMYVLHTGIPGKNEGVVARLALKDLPVPRVTLTADRVKVNGGGTVRLTWKTFAVDKVKLSYDVYVESDNAEETIHEPRPGEAPLELNKSGYPVSSNSRKTQVKYILSTWLTNPVSGIDSDTGSADVTVENNMPALKPGGSATPAYHLAEPSTLKWQALYATTSVVTDPSSGARISVPHPTTSLAAPCGLRDLTIQVTSPSGFPAAGAFDVQVDQEILTVTTGHGTTNWTVTRRPDQISDHAAGSDVLGATVTYTLPSVRRGNNTVKLQACSGSFASRVEDVVVPIRPRITRFDAALAISRVGGPGVTLSWDVDDSSATILLDGTPLGTRREWTFQVQGAKRFALTATGVPGAQDTSSVVINAYTLHTIDVGNNPCWMFPSPDRTKLYVVNLGSRPMTLPDPDRTVAVIDISSRKVMHTITIPSAGRPTGVFGKVANGRVSIQVQRAPGISPEYIELDFDLGSEVISSTASTSLNRGSPASLVFSPDGLTLDPQGTPESWAPVVRAAAVRTVFRVLRPRSQSDAFLPAVEVIDYEFVT